MARENNSTKAEINTIVLFAEGAFKNVYLGKYTEGSRKGEECVCKIFKSGSVFSESFFANDLKVVAKALEIVNKFNSLKVITRQIWLNVPTIWTFLEGSKRRKEPY